MIYTVTLNPALDYHLSLKQFQEGHLNLPDHTYYQSGGKGINVSKVLKNYGVSSIGLGFLGGFTGQFIQDELTHLGIQTRFIALDSDTRINVKLNHQGLETELAGTAPIIPSEAQAALIEQISQLIQPNDIIVLSGSVPSGISNTFYADIIESLPQGTGVILDTRGEAFDHALKKGVLLVKPNRDELTAYFGRPFDTQAELIQAGKDLQQIGAQYVIISLGREGSIFITPEIVMIGNVPGGTLVSSVGAGDSMVAGFVYGLTQSLSTEEIYRFAIASASASVYSEHLATYEDFNQILPEVILKGVLSC